MAEKFFKNVQVLKGITVSEFMGTMGFFSASLGYSCENCHSGNDWSDYIADTNPKKRMARGMVAIVGFKQCLIPFDRPARFAGDTNYNRFLGSLRIGFNGIFCFSSHALVLSTLFGFFFIAIALLLGAISLLNFWVRLSLPSLSITLFTTLFLGGIQLVTIGILGEYIGRIYEEVRRRPKFIVEHSLGFGKNP